MHYVDFLYLVIEVDEHGSWDYAKDSKPCPIVVVDGVCRVEPELCHGYL